MSYNARTDRFSVRRKVRRRRVRLDRSSVKRAGDCVQIDAISVFVDGVKRYLVVGVDMVTRFAFGWCYRSLSSHSSRQFLRQLVEACPFEIKGIQTGNGSEFAGYFAEEAERLGLAHYHTPVRSPRWNGRVERFARTVGEQHVQWHLEEIEDVESFNAGLMRYLLWYNTRRVHRSLRYQTPLGYYLAQAIADPEEPQKLWTLTCS